MMMSRLTIGLLLVYVTSIQSAPHTVVKRGASAADLPRINAIRRELAKTSGLSVPDLVWDEALVAQAGAMSNKCDGQVNTLNSRFAPDDPDRNGFKLMAVFYAVILAIGGAEKFPEKFSKVDKDQLSAIATQMQPQVNTPGFTLGHFELFNPLQTKIGCAPTKCEGVIPPEVLQVAAPLQLEGNMFAFYSVCVLGPSGVWDMSQLQKAGNAAQSVPAMTGGSPTSTWSIGTIALISILYLPFL